MKILLDILHPAHVHFFRNAIAVLRDRDHEVIVTARDKDLTLRLLELFEIPYRTISCEASNRTGLARELLGRNVKMLQIVRAERPAVLASIGGVSTAQVGFMTRTRNLIFYDTENASLSNLLSYPLASEVLTPDCYQGRVLGRQTKYAGYHELAYLHSDRFVPQREVLERAGVDPDTPFSVVRFVSWKAVHDVKAEGLSVDQKLALVDRLEQYGRIFITSEAELPSSLERCRLPVSPGDIHHLLAFSRLFIGESATMASESVILGTPAIYLDPVGRGYTDEQEKRYGLCFNYRPREAGKAIAQAESVLAADLKHSHSFVAGVARLHSEKTDVTDFVVQKLTQGS